MSDYISRRLAVDGIWSHATEILETSDYSVLFQDIYKMAHRHIVELILSLPSADVQPVVYCKDCKWFKTPDNTTHMIKICHKYSGVRSGFDFCSRGERKEQSNDL